MLQQKQTLKTKARFNHLVQHMAAWTQIRPILTAVGPAQGHILARDAQYTRSTFVSEIRLDP